MRVSREQAAENRARVVALAAQLFRERGLDGIGVADLMKAAGLTHGGFYGQFESKEALAAEACAAALAQSLEAWERRVGGAEGEPFAALVESYLSERHRDHAGQGCVLAALAAEAARRPTGLRRALTEGLERLLAVLEPLFPGRGAAIRRRRALAAYSQMLGALVLARAVDDPDLSREILAASREALTH